MKDTSETLVCKLGLPMVPADNEMGDDIALERRPPCRFKVGDEIVPAFYPDKPYVLRYPPYWDREFGGWLIVRGLIGIHESNFILASERGQWKPHADGLWSWWTKKEAANGANQGI